MPRSTVLPVSSRVWLRVAAVSFIAMAAAGCSDSARFNNGILASNKSAPETTGSIASRPSSKVVSQPLPAPSRPQTAAAQSQYGTTQGGQRLGAYRPASSEVTGSVTQRAAPPVGHWTWEGGTPVTVSSGETLEIVAHKYGVPASAILQANNLNSAADVRAGQRLVIPRYVVANAAPHAPASIVAAPRSMQAPSPVHAAASVHVVKPGEGLIGIAREYNMSVYVLAKANNMLPYAKVNAGDQLKIPAGHGASQQQAVAPHAEPPRAPAPQQIATAPATQNARIVTPEPAKEAAPVKAAEATGALPSFRWPVKGRVITAFGAKSNGTQNDGINVAVPEGTPVKAAEDGVVAYAGSELKGYGNLVLVRHSNGFVSAYANASELMVKRGDTVKRGQVIARAGQTGNVASPQLHFEIRKGSTPVDPAQYLARAE
ncbi:MAG: peptidoglycan DD-metalloendopeptidase family protein [Pseudolabrys sp.]